MPTDTTSILNRINADARRSMEPFIPLIIEVVRRALARRVTRDRCALLIVVRGSSDYETLARHMRERDLTAWEIGQMSGGRGVVIARPRAAVEETMSHVLPGALASAMAGQFREVSDHLTAFFFVAPSTGTGMDSVVVGGLRLGELLGEVRSPYPMRRRPTAAPEVYLARAGSRRVRDTSSS